MVPRAPARLSVLLALGAAACSVEAPPAPAPASGPHVAWFEGGFEEALQQARAQRRLVLVDLWTSWCPPCRRLEKETFPDAAVIEELATMVPLSVDAESLAGEPLLERYRVKGYPTILVLDADGREVGRIERFLPPEEFLRQVQGIRRNVGR